MVPRAPRGMPSDAPPQSVEAEQAPKAEAAAEGAEAAADEAPAAEASAEASKEESKEADSADPDREEG